MRVPLPETNDPYVLLGVAPGADDISVSQAFARLMAAFPDEHVRLSRAAYIVTTLSRRPAGAGDVQPDPDLVERFARRFDARQYEQLWDELMEARHDARERPAAWVAVAPVVGAMAWRKPNAPALAEQLGMARHVGVEAVRATLAKEIELAARMRAVAAVVPEPLFDLFAGALIESARQRSETLAAAAPLLGGPEALLAVCDELVARDGWLAGALLERTQRESRLWGKRAIAPLPAEIQTELDRRLRAIRYPLRFLRGALGGAFAAGGAAAGIALAFATGTPDVMFLPWGTGVAAAAATMRGGMTGTYRARIRPQLAAVFCDLGVQADVTGAWLGLQPRFFRGALAAHADRIRADAALSLLGAIAALVREDARAPRFSDRIL